MLVSAACVAPVVVQEASKSFVKTRASSSSNLTGHRAMATGVKIFTRVHYLFPENQKCAALVRLRMSWECPANGLDAARLRSCGGRSGCVVVASKEHDCLVAFPCFDRGSSVRQTYFCICIACRAGE